MTIYADNSYSIGNTPLVRLKHFGHNGNVVVKIIKLERTIPSHRVNLTEDYADVQQLAKRQEEQKLMARWIQRKQQSIYMRIDKKFADCKFQYPYWKEKMAE